MRPDEATRSTPRPPTDPAPWTTRRLLAWTTERFETRGVDAPRVVAEMLLAHVIDCDRMRLYMEVDRPASPEELTALRALVRRAGDHEPVQYLVGRASFYGRQFLVEPSTMIPQPSTEDLVSAVIDWLERRAGHTTDSGTGEGAEPSAKSAEPVLIADLGTGSGCIAVTLALRLEHARVIATDVVPEALDLARRNVERFGVDARVELREGPGLDPIREPGPPERFDVICGNLPYIPDHEWSAGAVQRAVREHVPETALRGGPDGLDCIRPIIAGAGAMLKPGGLLALEIADCQRDAVIDLAEQVESLHTPRALRDYEGLWRVLLAERR